MPRKALLRPTDGELEILNVLWTQGGRTVREICDALGHSKGERPSPEAVLTRLDIMAKKGLARRDEARSPKIFAAAVDQTRTQRELLRDFLKRVFGGSAQKLMLHALEAKSATPQELDELSKRLKELRATRGKRTGGAGGAGGTRGAGGKGT